MPSKKNTMMQGVVQSLIVAVVMAVVTMAAKTYVDVQLLKAKFEYTNGRWDLPVEAK